MIENEWYVILEALEVPRNKPITVTRFNEKMVLWRTKDGEVCCIHDQCCHRGTSLGIGKVQHNYLECPFHGFQYDHTGKVRQIPANGRKTLVPDNYKVQSYLVKELYGFIWLWWGQANEQTPPSPYFFEDLITGFTYSSFVDHWPVHYSRCIENQLDVLHLPFVHYNTIGRGNRKLVHGPVIKREGSFLKFFVDNVVDNGNIVPLKASEIQDYQSLPQLHFYFPSIWQNLISEKVRVFLAFVPVDEDNTVIYARYYQKIVRIPLLRSLVNWLGIVFSRVILNQDKRVVITQRPKKSDLIMGENLVAGDLPIIEYRKYREELKKKAQ
jgi:phenylpropionate dioxygenase-like ring-hydroxylating dioxygenase large terminal subunit